MVPIRQNQRDGWRSACEALEKIKAENGIPFDSGQPSTDNMSDANIRFILYGLRYELACKQYMLGLPIEEPKK